MSSSLPLVQAFHKRSVRCALLALLGMGLWWMPHTARIPDEGWHLFALFLTTLVGIMGSVLPMGVLSLFALTAVTITGTLPLEEALSGFHSEVSWIIVLAFFISLGFTKTGLANRIAYFFVALCGRTPLRLGYGVLATELILAPAIPSVTARTGGILFPIVQELIRTFPSPAMGGFLMKLVFQGSVITCTMFLTAMAANPFLVELTRFHGIEITWASWAAAALLPGLLSLLLLPPLLYKLLSFQPVATDSIQRLAKERLRLLGPLSRQEWGMLGVFILLLTLWIFGHAVGIKTATTALLGLSCLLLLGILEWRDLMEDAKAWDTFFWFSTLITLANALNSRGVIDWLSEILIESIHGFPWMVAFGLLLAVYFYSHYLFVSITGHVGAMYPAFLLVALGVGTPPLLAIYGLIFASNLFGGLTHYGSGSAPLLFSGGYLSVKQWWRIGFLLSLVNLLLWFGVGPFWWKLLKLW